MDANETNPLSLDPQQQVRNNLQFNDAVTQVADPLSLDIPDNDLAIIVKERIETSQKFFKDKYNLLNRREKNEMYLFGRQLDQMEKDKKLKGYESRSSDNALYEIEASLKPLAMSRLPDIIVTPGNNDPEREQSSKDLTLVLNDQNKTREQREILGLGFKHLPTYFTAVLKARWDNDKGKFGDSRFDIIHPEYIVIDHTATSRNPDDMSFIAQCVPMSIQDVIMKFPKKKDKFIEAVKLQSVLAGQTPTWKELATEVKIWEVWFDWYKRKGKKELLKKSDLMSIYEPGIEWERVSGVLWCYGDNLILDKMLDPNFDHEGDEKLFTYGKPGDETTKKAVRPEELLMSTLLGQPIPNLSKDKIYHNYFDRPHKPFYFFGYDQWGKIAYDETSRIEQNIRNQENLDDQNKTILDQLKTRVKHIWSKDSGLDKSAVQRLDMDDPRMDALVEGDPNNVHKAIEPERPDAAQFNARENTLQRMYGISGSSAVRGQIQSDVATTNQIAREADFTRTDDLVEDTINAACEWIADWRMQFIKLRYTDGHMMEILGSKGEATYIQIRRDSIFEGMNAKIKSSSTDKLKAQRNAMQTAQLGAPYTNPIDFFQDMDMNDPEGRAERGIMFSIDPASYFTKYVLKLDGTKQQADALIAGVAPGVAPTSTAQPNPTVAEPQGPTPTDTTQTPIAPAPMPEASPRSI